MQHYKRLQNAIDYIEDHLHDPINLTDVSQAAFSSLSYFHRIFYFMTGYTVKEYIRKRRLSKAAYDLRCTQTPITEIAFNAGYETLESFTRAFKKNFALGPREFRNNNQEQSLFEKLDILKFSSTLPTMPDFDLNLEYVLFKQSQVSGFLTHTTIEDGQQAIDICNFANDIMGKNKLANYFDLRKTPIFGVYTDMTDENEFDYTIGCLTSSSTNSSTELTTHIIPSSRYAKFSLSRLDRIKEAWHYIYGQWFPKNDEYRTPGFDFEIYQRDSVDIYIPMNREHE